jgi:DNA-binding response OmpR family regulator
MKRVLVVEDDPVNARVLSDYLSAHGYATSVAVTGLEGLERFLADKPDLMLVDVLLPRKNGFELCFDVKRTEQGKQTPVLLMSAVYKDLRHAEEYSKRDLAAEGFLLKPFELSELLHRVRFLVGDPEPAQA